MYRVCGVIGLFAVFVKNMDAGSIGGRGELLTIAVCGIRCDSDLSFQPTTTPTAMLRAAMLPATIMYLMGSFINQFYASVVCENRGWAYGCWT